MILFQKKTEKGGGTGPQSARSTKDTEKDRNGMYPCNCDRPLRTQGCDVAIEPKIKDLCVHCGGRMK